jgi:L-threonylcarbamoyladenylate synthase
MNTLLLPADEPLALQQAFNTLLQGGLVAFPTDTVYGLGALAHNTLGIEQLYAVKGRQAEKAIPILLSDISELSVVASQVDTRARRLAECFWPGPLTLVVPHHPSLPAVLSPYPTVGVRVPDHPVALELLRLTGPLATTSANLSNQPSSTSAGEVFAQLGGRIPLILDAGKTPGGISSTVVDCSGAELVILRQGPLSMEQLQAALE